MAEEAFVVQNEDQAWELLERLIEGLETAPSEGRPIVLRGWPKLKIHLPKTRRQSAITPSMMEGLVDIQHSLYRAYAVAQYDDASARTLTKRDKEALEFTVVVSKGSSIYEVDFTQVLNHLTDSVMAKMDPLHVTIILLGLGLTFFGYAAFSKWLEFRLKKRKVENRSKEVAAQLEHVRFLSEKETDRMKILADAIAKQEKVGKILEEATEVHHALVKSVAASNGGTVQGVPLDGAIAEELITNARRTGEDVRIDGRFGILRVDATHRAGFMVRLQNADTAEIINAELQDAMLSEDHRSVIREAEWRKAPVDCKINARRVGGTITKAVVMDATAVEEHRQPTRTH